MYYVSKKYIHYSNAQNIIQTKRHQVHLVCSTFGITSKSQCCHNPLQFFHMGGTPWCEVLPSICYSSQIVFCSYQLYELLKSQLEFKFALPSLKAFIIKQTDKTLNVVTAFLVRRTDIIMKVLLLPKF